MKKLFFLIPILIFAVMFVSCRQEPENAINSNEPISSSGKNAGGVELQEITHDYSGVWNSSNPYDSTGYWHNDALDYIAENRNEIDSNNIWASVEDLIIEYYENDYTPTQIQNTIDDTESFFDGIDSYNDIADCLESEGIFTDSTTLALVDDLSTILQNYSSDSTSLTYFYSDIRDLESVIMNASISNSDEQTLLEGTSIIRFSVCYWQEVDNDEDHPWRDMDNDGQAAPAFLSAEDIGNIIAIGTADYLGGQAGGAVGAVTGSAAMALYCYWDEITNWVSDAWDTLTGWLF